MDIQESADHSLRTAVVNDVPFVNTTVVHAVFITKKIVSILHRVFRNNEESSF